MTNGAETKRTPLFDFHLRHGARIVDFAGYDMPVQYKDGVLKEHLHSRAKAGLFDVSHMGQIRVTGDGVDLALEQVMPQALVELPAHRQRYGFLTNDAGGILDDIMVTRLSDTAFHLVVNAGGKDAMLAHLQSALPQMAFEPVTDAALLALQGPLAEQALAAHAPGAETMRFMDHRVVDSAFGPLSLSRSGYTGDDGFEISVAADQAEAFAEALLTNPDVAPIGLGARDSLRLEAGLCLHGSDIDAATNPVEADLTWAIQKTRRTGGARAGGYPGAGVIQGLIDDGPPRKRAGLLPEGRAPMRAGTALFASAEAEAPIGHVTSGAYGPSIERPMSMGYVAHAHAAPETPLWGEVRGKRMPVTVTPVPFRPATFKR